MTKTETVIRSIFGAAGIDTRPLARAVDIINKGCTCIAILF